MLYVPPKRRLNLTEVRSVIPHFLENLRSSKVRFTSQNSIPWSSVSVLSCHLLVHIRMPSRVFLLLLSPERNCCAFLILRIRDVLRTQLVLNWVTLIVIICGGQYSSLQPAQCPPARTSRRGGCSSVRGPRHSAGIYPVWNRSVTTGPQRSVNNLHTSIKRSFFSIPRSWRFCWSNVSMIDYVP